MLKLTHWKLGIFEYTRVGEIRTLRLGKLLVYAVGRKVTHTWGF